MIPVALGLPGDSLIPELARAVVAAGGRLLVVGGWVRDALVGQPSKDFDLEVFGLSAPEVTTTVAALGFSGPVGRQLPVWKNTRARLDLALPRAGGELYDEGEPDSLSRAYRAAARHRDLTLNAIAWDPLDARLLDPLGGREDLESRVLRAADAETFGDDPLRVLRVARLAARLSATPDDALVEICRGLDLSEVSVERVGEELRRLLVEPQAPSRAFEWLARLGQLEVLAPIAALEGVPQDPNWHPEGDVGLHTRMVIDRAAEIARELAAEGGPTRGAALPDAPGNAAEVLLFAALCHDLGKPETTRVEGDRIRSFGHEARSAEIAAEWLASLRFGTRFVTAVATLVAHHLAPVQLVSQDAGPRAYRRLARKLDAGGVSLVELERLARADQLGRTTAEARAGRFEAGRIFLERAARAGVATGVARDVVPAALAMRSGVPAGPALGRLLARCREIQDETGWTDAERILARARRERPAEPD